MKLEARLREGGGPTPTAWCRSDPPSEAEEQVAAGLQPLAEAVAVEEAVAEAEVEVVLVVLFIAAVVGESHALVSGNCVSTTHKYEGCVDR
ncbi:hypothetical protein M5D96_007567 [Drosophila gunungcola]|uniref:Uncharacterized protein n=1 Tax=Drosophila gunungcola TaxID=103775 RepID=A0A9P9YNG5_9MUSC|nr:hypothetical protein M5D96_007567 [Drosophila gunungcola]